MKKLTMSLLLLLPGIALAERIDQTVLEQFVTAQTDLQAQITAMCEGDKKITPIASWQQAASGWFAVQALQLPAAEFVETGFAYVFWPDPKDRLRKQVTQAISQPPAQEDWKDLPASVRSLSAIEYLLMQEKPTQYCDWLQTISAHQVAQSQQFSSLQRFYDFERAEQIAALHGTALTLHAHLKDVLSNDAKLNWFLAPGWRSESQPIIENALLLQTQKLLALFAGKHQDIVQWQNQLKSLPMLSLSSTRADIEKVNSASEAFAEYVENTLAPALDIYMGFNNFDGD